MGHTDVTFVRRPSLGSLLRALEEAVTSRVYRGVEEATPAFTGLDA